MRLRTCALLLAAAACDDGPVLSVLPDPLLQVDILEQRPAALVDILWVVDSSGSMGPFQRALAANFDAFIAGLTTCQGTGVSGDRCDFDTRTCLVSGTPCNPPDYHIGVITMDMQAEFDRGRLRRVGLCAPSPGAPPAADRYRYCRGNDLDCTLDPEDPDAHPSNTTCDMSQVVPFVTATTPGARAAFSRAVRVGTDGSGREQGLAAAAAALGRSVDRDTGELLPAPAENEGFLRPDAALFLIFVSDEEDESFGEPAYYYRAFETVKGRGNEGLVSISAIVGDPDPDGRDGTDPGGCEIPNPVDGRPPIRVGAGDRYVGVAMYSRGLSGDLRVCDGGRLGCADGQSCQVPVEALPGICVPSGACATDTACSNFSCGSDGCVPCEAGQCRAEPRRFLGLLEQAGVFGSICAADFAPVLSALGFEAAGLSRRFPLTLTPTCSAEEVTCCEEGVPDDSCARTERLCVLLDGAPVANDRARGFVYDGGGNAVFFDGETVPGPGSRVQIRYRPTQAAESNCVDILN